jgi:IS5 family transposase
LSDPAMEDALITDRIPDETTILAFRHLQEQNDLGEQIFEAVKANGMAMKQGTIIDATIIAAPSSTKNEKRRYLSALLSARCACVEHIGIAYSVFWFMGPAAL